MVSAILSVLLVNWGYKLFMRLIGASVMFFDWKKKIVWYVIVWLILMSLIGI